MSERWVEQRTLPRRFTFPTLTHRSERFPTAHTVGVEPHLGRSALRRSESRQRSGSIRPRRAPSCPQPQCSCFHQVPRGRNWVLLEYHSFRRPAPEHVAHSTRRSGFGESQVLAGDLLRNSFSSDPRFLNVEATTDKQLGSASPSSELHKSPRQRQCYPHHSLSSCPSTSWQRNHNRSSHTPTTRKLDSAATGLSPSSMPSPAR